MRARSTRQSERVSASRALQRVLYRSAKHDPHRRFHALYDKLYRADILLRAWDDVRSNRGAPGIDGVTIEAVENTGVDEFLRAIAARLGAKTYRPAPLRRVHIPKPGRPDQTRPLGIPTVADRVVMAAAKIVLEPIFEADFLPVSYGFRPRRHAHHAMEAVRQAANSGRNWVLDADLKDCFGQISHEALMAELARRVSDRDMLKLLRSWLRAGVVENGALADSVAGTPQGSPISPLLCNVALHVLDQAWMVNHASLGTLVRFADDLVVLCSSRARVLQARDQIARILEPLGLVLHPDKTRIVDLSWGREGFDFLGFHHHKVKSARSARHFILRRWPSQAAMRQLRSKVRSQTSRRAASRPLEAVVADVNRIVRGWGNYFRGSLSYRKYWAVNAYVYERLERVAAIKHGRRGHWRPKVDFYRLYPHLGVYCFTGRDRRAAHALR